MENVLVSGATSFLGKEVVRLLKQKYNVDTISKTNADIESDLSEWRGGLSQDRINELKGRYAIFIHLEGIWNFTSSSKDFYENNICAAHGALSICESLNIPCFINSSSMVTVINQRGTISPYTINTGLRFPDYYSRSEALTEEMISYFPTNATTTINLKFGYLAGSTENGHIEKIDGIYRVIEFIRKFKKAFKMMPFLCFIPVSKTNVPMVPVDIAAKALVDILEQYKDQSGYKSFYISPKNGPLQVEIYRHIFEKLNIKKKIVPINFIPNSIILFLCRLIKSIPSSEISYALCLPTLDTNDTEKALGSSWCPEYRQYKETLWKGYEEFLSNS